MGKLPGSHHRGLFRMLGDFARLEGCSIASQETAQRFLDSVGAVVRHSASNPIMVYGFRTEHMFGYVASSLGNCKLIKEEETDATYLLPGLAAPDYRIVNADDEQFLVEVKNYHQNSPTEDFTIKDAYLSKLQSYASTTKTPLKIAIYWSKWNLWTLNDVKHLKQVDGIAHLSMRDAFLGNEMGLLGDYWVGTIPPLSFRIYADRNAPQTRIAGGLTEFRCAHASIYANGAELLSPFERQLAWFFMLNGSWSDQDKQCLNQQQKIEYVELSQRPVEMDESQGFATIGFMSAMISRQYRRATTLQGEVSNIRPKFKPDELGVVIPKSYSSDSLPLWRFYQMPNFERVAKPPKVVT